MYVSTLQQWFPCGPLLACHLTRYIPGLFLPRSRPCLLNKAAEGGLEPTPASRFRGAAPHQLNSCAPPQPFGCLLCSWHTVTAIPESEGLRSTTLSSRDAQPDRFGYLTVSQLWHLLTTGTMALISWH